MTTRGAGWPGRGDSTAVSRRDGIIMEANWQLPALLVV